MKHAKRWERQPVFRRARGRVHRAELGFADMDVRRLFEHGEAAAVGGVEVLASRTSPACRKPKCDVSMSPSRFCSQLQSRWVRTILASSRIAHGRLDLRERRRDLARPHVDVDQPGPLQRPIGLRPHPLGKPMARRQVRLVQAIAVDVELPAVIAAADAVLLVAAEEERRAAVRAAMVHDADATRAVAERDQLLAQQHQPHGITVGLELRGHKGRNPELPHQVAHRGAGPDARQDLVFGQ